MPTAETSKERFIKLLRNRILKLDLVEQLQLDFGIYRILKYRQREIDAYLYGPMVAEIDRMLQHGVADELERKRERLDALAEEMRRLAEEDELDGAAFPNGELHISLRGRKRGRDYLELEREVRRAELSGANGESESNDLYNTLFNFFVRYYADGDFMPQPRRSHTIHYNLPYDGEDTFFYWRSRGSHYIKSYEELRSYRFGAGAWQVRFALVNADVEKNNVKGKTRYFFPLVKKAKRDEANNRFDIPFEYRPPSQAEEKKYAKGANGNGNGNADGADEDEAETSGNGNGKLEQDAVLREAVAQLSGELPPTIDAQTLLDHLRRFAQKSRSDYFVHRNLRQFLREQFDFYLKDSYFNLDGLTDAQKLTARFAGFALLRRVGYEIIDWLDRIEAVQARLFEKRKFVLASDWLIPLRFLPAALHTAAAANTAQREEWQRLFGLRDISDLAAHPTLPLNTAHFDDDFKRVALAAYPDIDAATDGILIHAENYAALRTLQPRIGGKVKVIYIDPPYNTGSDGFIYKDDFSQHSTWLTMMEERLELAREMLTDDGIIFVSIDDNEQSRLKELMDAVFGVENFVAEVIWQKSKKGDAKLIAVIHEYIIVYAKDKEVLTNNGVWRQAKEGAAEVLQYYSELRRLYRSDHETIANEMRKWYASLPKDDVRRNHEHYRWSDERGLYFTADFAGPDDGRTSRPRYDIIHPATGKPVKKPSTGWRWDEARTKRALEANPPLIHFGPDETTVPTRKSYLYEIDTEPFASVFYKDGRAGTLELESLVGAGLMDFPKNTDVIERIVRLVSEAEDTVLDFFAGSGTTGHAVINLNREDNGHRRFVLVEQGEYFKDVLLPRIAKVMYCPDWKDGQPQLDSASGGGNGKGKRGKVAAKGMQADLLSVAAGAEQAAVTVDSADDWIARSPRLVKVLRLESYEDALDALELQADAVQGQLDFREDFLLRYTLPPHTETPATPASDGYDYRSDRPAVLLDPERLAQPFGYKLRHMELGKEVSATVDLVESFNLLRGLQVVAMQQFDDAGRRYVVVTAKEGDAAVLVVWREVGEDFDPERDRAFLSANLKLEGISRVYHNADMVLPQVRTQSLDPLFQQAIDPAGREE